MSSFKCDEQSTADGVEVGARTQELWQTGSSVSRRIHDATNSFENLEYVTNLFRPLSCLGSILERWNKKQM